VWCGSAQVSLWLDVVSWIICDDDRNERKREEKRNKQTKKGRRKRWMKEREKERKGT
jgi:hypothetical protein